MMDYSGIPCPVCSEKFDVLDDIVVCPECGAPYHRECYRKTGHCVFEEKHADHEAWKPPVQENTEQKASSSEEERTKACPRCAMKNFPDALFCDKCGLPFSSGPANASPFGGMPRQGFPQGVPMGGIPVVLDPLGGVSPTEEFKNGVTAGELAKYVKTNTPYFLPVFKRIRDEGRGKFSFSAFICGGGWLLYRKNYKVGLWLTLAMALLMLFGSFFSSFYVTPLLTNLANQAGIDLQNSANLMYSNEFMQLIMKQDAGTLAVLFIPTILRFLQIGLMIFTGFMGNKLYYRHCISTVAKIKAEASNPEEAAQTLQEQGGINVTLAMVLLLLGMMITYLPMILSMFTLTV